MPKRYKPKRIFNDFKDKLRIGLRVYRYSIKTTPFDFIMAIVALTVTILIPIAVGFYEKNVIDEVIKLLQESPEVRVYTTITTFILITIALHLLKDFAWTINDLAEKRVFYKIQEALTFEFLRKTVSLDLQHFENPKNSNLFERANSTYYDSGPSMSIRMTWLIRYLVGILSTITIITIFSPLFTIILTITSLPVLIMNFKYSRSAWAIWDADTHTRRMFSSIHNSLASERSFMEIKMLSSSGFLLKMLKDLYNKFKKNEERIEKQKTFYDWVSGTVSTLGVSAFWIFAIYKVLNGDISVGSLSFYIGIAGSYTNSLESLMRELSRFYRDSSFIKSYYQFLDLPTRIVSGDKKLSPKSQPPEIVFKHVDFVYPGSKKTVIENFDLTISPGDRIAFVGANGSGKSTIIKLLCHLYDVSSGSIVIDGVDLRDLDLKAWYEQIGVLFQDFNRYQFLSASENIAIGDVKRKRSMESVLEASVKAEAHDFLNKLDKGYSQILSKKFKKGTELSGGEWQKVALARNFYRDAPILILDEPTASIDAESEEKIFERLYKFAENKTVIIVSHRFSTVRKADKIYVLEEGKIIENGTHQELMKLGGKYAQAFTLQAKGYK